MTVSETSRTSIQLFFVECVRNVNELFLRRRSMYINDEPGDLPKNVADSLDVDIDARRRLRVIQHSEDKFEVQRNHGEKEFRVVDVKERTCSCGKPQEEMLPCRHICAASLVLRKDPRDLVPLPRRVGALRQVYSMSVNPVDLTQLVRVPIGSPLVRRGRGPQSVKQIRSAAETTSRQMVCSSCHRKGHNKRTCRAPHPS